MSPGILIIDESQLPEGFCDFNTLPDKPFKMSEVDYYYDLMRFAPRVIIRRGNFVGEGDILPPRASLEAFLLLLGARQMGDPNSTPKECAQD